MPLPLCVAGTLAFCTSLCVVRAAKNSKAVFLHADRRLSAGKAEHYLKWSMSLMFERLTDTGSDPCSTLGNAAERQTAQHLHPGRHHGDIRSIRSTMESALLQDYYCQRLGTHTLLCSLASHLNRYKEWLQK